MATLEQVADRVRDGDPAAIARMISFVESGREGVAEAVGSLYRDGGRAHVVGVTGPAGSGKSTLVAALGRELRDRGVRVAVLAVDPSSSFSGGSILGDRIRMDDASEDPGTFFRSMATRGALGGLSRATSDAITVLDAAGFDHVLVETVGAGQVEIDIAATSHTVIVVSVPGLGDDIQTIKAGLLEIADVHVVNKADLDGANKAVTDLKAMLRLGDRGEGAWKRPVLAVTSTRDEGLDGLANAIAEHRRWLEDSGRLAHRELEIAEARVRTIAQSLVLQRMRTPEERGRFESILDGVRDRRLDPFEAARLLVEETVREGDPS